MQNILLIAASHQLYVVEYHCSCPAA